MARALPLIARRIPPAGISRLLIVVLGGLLVLQSSPGLGPQKVAYLVLVATALLFAGRAVWNQRHRRMVEAALPWLMVSALLLALVALSLPVAIAHGTPITQWFRDAATYGLLAVAPVIALDAAASMRSELLVRLTVLTTAFGALSYAIYWVTARNLAVLPFEHLVLPTSSLPTTLFVLALGAAVIDTRRRLAWMVVGGLAFGIFLVTGTRSALLLLVAFPVVMVIAGRSRLPWSAAASAGTGLVALVFVVLVQAAFVSAGQEVAPPIDIEPPIATPSVSLGASPGTSPVASPVTPTPTPRAPPNPDANFLERLKAFLSSPERDGSIRERVVQYQLAWELFASSPIVGVGLGHPFVWTRIDGRVVSDFTADTPLILPAKLGILGAAWIVLFAIVWLQFLRRLWRVAGITVAGLAMAGWAATLAVLAWSGLSLEDKGFSFALMFLLALSFVELERAASAGEAGPAQRGRPGLATR